MQSLSRRWFVVLKQLKLSVSKLVSYRTQSFFKIIAESTLHPTAVIIEKCSHSLAFSSPPLSFVNSLYSLGLRSTLNPIVCSEPLRIIIFPASLIFLRWRNPIHYSFPFFLVLSPFTFVLVTRRILHFALSFPQSSVELTIIDSSIAKC